MIPFDFLRTPKSSGRDIRNTSFTYVHTHKTSFAEKSSRNWTFSITPIYCCSGSERATKNLWPGKIFLFPLTSVVVVVVVDSGSAKILSIYVTSRRAEKKKKSWLHKSYVTLLLINLLQYDRKLSFPARLCIPIIAPMNKKSPKFPHLLTVFTVYLSQLIALRFFPSQSSISKLISKK